MRDEKQRPKAKLSRLTMREHISGAVGQRHCRSKPTARVRLIAKRPDASVRKSLAQPHRPKAAFKGRVRAPGIAWMTVEPMDEDNVGRAIGTITTSEGYKSGHMIYLLEVCGVGRSTWVTWE